MKGGRNMRTAFFFFRLNKLKIFKIIIKQNITTRVCAEPTVSVQQESLVKLPMIRLPPSDTS